LYFFCWYFNILNFLKNDINLTWKKNVFFYLIQFSWVLHDIVSLIYWTKFFAVLKSIYFKKTVVRISFFQNCGTFNTNQNKQYHNFERNESCATVFLKWTDFSSFMRRIIILWIFSFDFSLHIELAIWSTDFWPEKL
jgi:hypothetical protein